MALLEAVVEGELLQLLGLQLLHLHEVARLLGEGDLLLLLVGLLPRLGDSFYRRADSCVLVFDVKNQASFDSLGKVGGWRRTLREEDMLKDAQLLFSVAFHEIIRQVSVHCLERGYLMGKIWWSEMELFQRLLQLNWIPGHFCEGTPAAAQLETATAKRSSAERQSSQNAVVAGLSAHSSRLRPAIPPLEIVFEP